MRYFLKLAYNGFPFFGWQRQHDEISVQEMIETALEILLKSEITITGCGRTDTGVNASLYYAHFDYHKKWTESEKQNLVYRLNAILPEEIAIYDLFQVADDAHARFDATLRTYRYYLSTQKDPFLYPFVYKYFKSLDIEKMNEAATLLLKTENFASFTKKSKEIAHYRCTVTDAFWTKKEKLLIFEISANRFLRDMVRAIVGTLLEVGLNKITIEEFQEIILKENRSKAGMSVPAHALFLTNVRYPYIKSDL